jgi:hypothetical protein
VPEIYSGEAPVGPPPETARPDRASQIGATAASDLATNATNPMEADSGRQPPGNGDGCGEKFPDLCLHSHGLESTLTPAPLNLNSKPLDTAVRPLSLSLQSTASSSEYYSERDTDLSSTFADSRRASVLSTASSIYSNGSSVAAQQQPLTRNRRDAKQLHTARIQRSGSNASPLGRKKTGADDSPTSKTKRFHRGTVGSSPQDAFAATEPPHEPLAKMDQQRWVTVQEKTFTKWLNTKLQERELEVKDLVKDLSDGVSYPTFPL